MLHKRKGEVITCAALVGAGKAMTVGSKTHGEERGLAVYSFGLC
jgi:hypothetical protein